jgi:hypothetical protein
MGTVKLLNANGELYKPVITGEMGNEYNRKNRKLLFASFNIIYCINCVSILYVFFNIYFPKLLGFVIRKLHFHDMDSKIIHATCMEAATTVITRKKYNLYTKRTTYKCNCSTRILY